MAKSVTSQVAFTAGEWSPKMDARVDQPNFHKAGRQIHNLIPEKHGGVTRRPGTQYVATCKYTDLPGNGTQHAASTYKFQYSPSTAFALEVGHQYARFYGGGVTASQVQVAYSTSSGTVPGTWVPSTAYLPGSYVSYTTGAGSFAVGTAYVISFLGSTNWYSCGWPASQGSPYVGGSFTATAAGSGNGNATSVYYSAAGVTSSQPPVTGTSWVSQYTLEQPLPYNGIYYPTNIPVSAGLVVGNWYSIASLGNTNWTAIGAINPAVGTYFQATGAGSGTGVVNGIPPEGGQVGGAWQAGVLWYKGQFVSGGGSGSWVCLTTYTSTASFANDLAKGYWLPLNYPTTPWTTDVFNVTTCQLNDDVFMVNANWPPQLLTRYSNTYWTSQQAQYLMPPLLDQNATDTTIAPSAVQGNGITLTAAAPGWVTSTPYEVGDSVEVSSVIYNCVQANVSGTWATDLLAGYWQAVPVFNSYQIGGCFQLAYLNNSTYLMVTGTAASGFTNSVVTNGLSNSGQLQALGGWEVHTYGTWSADIAIQQSLDGGITWNTVRTVSGRSDRNIDITGTAVQLSMYQFVLTNCSTPVSPGATNPRVVFENVNSFLYGLVQITGVTNSYVATANVIQNIPTTANTATEYWSEGAWSNYRGFPQAVCTFQQRVIYGSSGYEPQRIWGTVTNDIQNLALGDQTQLTDSFAFDLAAVGRGPIQWLSAQNDIIVGFSGAEWTVNSGQGTGGSQVISPQQVNATEASTWGSCFPSVPAVVVGDATFFVQRQGRTVRQTLFSIYTNKYMSTDMGYFSDHLFNTGINQMDFQAQFENQGIVWVVTSAGTLCGMTYELENGIIGWSRHTTGDGTGTALDFGFESVTCIYGTLTNDDEVWTVVNRSLASGAIQRIVERVNPVKWQNMAALGAPLANFAYYVDCGVQAASPATNTIAVSSVLNGRQVNVCVNGSTVSGLTASNGLVTIPGYVPAAGDVVSVGLPMAYHLQAMRLDFDERAGITQGLDKAISDIYLRLFNSLSGNVSNGTVQTPINYGTQGQVIFTTPALFTGEMRVQPFSDISTDPAYVITANDALPLTVLAFIVVYDVIPPQ